MRGIEIVLPHIIGFLPQLSELMQTKWFLEISMCTIKVNNKKYIMVIFIIHLYIASDISLYNYPRYPRP